MRLYNTWEFKCIQELFWLELIQNFDTDSDSSPTAPHSLNLFDIVFLHSSCCFPEVDKWGNLLSRLGEFSSDSNMEMAQLIHSFVHLNAHFLKCEFCTRCCVARLDVLHVLLFNVGIHLNKFTFSLLETNFLLSYSRRNFHADIPHVTLSSFLDSQRTTTNRVNFFCLVDSLNAVDFSASVK